MVPARPGCGQAKNRKKWAVPEFPRSLKGEQRITGVEIKQNLPPWDSGALHQVIADVSLFRVEPDAHEDDLLPLPQVLLIIFHLFDLR